MREMGLFCSAAAFSLIATLGLAQEIAPWKRVQIPGVPFSAELPTGKDVYSADTSQPNEQTGGGVAGQQLTLEPVQPGQGMNNSIRLQFSDRWDDAQTGFQYQTGHLYEDRKLLDSDWGAPETKRWQGFLVHEIGARMGPSQYFPKLRRDIYYIVEMGPRRFFSVHLSCEDEDLPRYAPLYMRIRDSLQTAGAKSGARRKSRR